MCPIEILGEETFLKDEFGSVRIASRCDINDKRVKFNGIGLIKEEGVIRTLYNVGGVSGLTIRIDDKPYFVVSDGKVEIMQDGRQLEIKFRERGRSADIYANGKKFIVRKTIL